MTEKKEFVSSLSKLTVWGDLGQRSPRAPVVGLQQNRQCWQESCSQHLLSHGRPLPEHWLPRTLGELMGFSWNEETITSDQKGMGNGICHYFSSVGLAHFPHFVAIVAILIRCYQIFIQQYVVRVSHVSGPRNQGCQIKYKTPRYIIPRYIKNTRFLFNK